MNRPLPQIHFFRPGNKKVTACGIPVGLGKWEPGRRTVEYTMCSDNTELVTCGRCEHSSWFRRVAPRAALAKGRHDKAIRAADRIKQLEAALRLFTGAAYPVAASINPRGYNWCEPYLDQALANARADEAIRAEQT